MGQEKFLQFAEDVMLLGQSKRSRSDQHLFRSILDEARESQITADTAKLITDELLLNKYSDTEIKTLAKDALFILANKDPVHEYNLKSLKDISSTENPVAIIKSATSQSTKKGVDSHFVGSSSPKTVLLCNNAQVNIAGKNFNPSWGLFNGAMGSIHAIVYAEDKSPNEGHQPLYVVVCFENYCGPVWNINDPKVHTQICSPLYTVH